jgi:hypothetical protein
MTLLPEGFGDLEPFAPTWCLATETQRWAQRMASPMDRLQEFYNVALPRIPDALAYCDGFDLNAMPEDAVRLLQLVYSFVMISFPVELWGQPWVPDSRGTRFDRVSEPVP